MKITDVLKKYRMKKADLEATQARIFVYQEALKSNNLHLLGYYTKKPVEAGMPRSNCSISPVEKEVFSKDVELELTRELVMEWIEEEKERLWSTRLEITQIEAALNALTKQERFIIERKYMDNLCWRFIELSYFEQYREQLTEVTLKRYNATAIDKLHRVLKPFYDKFALIR